MTTETVKIVPRAANAFNIEMNQGFSEKLAYVLEVHTDQDRLSITAKNEQGEIMDLQVVIGFWDKKGNQTIPFHHITIESVKKTKS